MDCVHFLVVFDVCLPFWGYQGPILFLCLLSRIHQIMKVFLLQFLKVYNILAFKIPGLTDHIKWVQLELQSLFYIFHRKSRSSQARR